MKENKKGEEEGEVEREGEEEGEGEVLKCFLEVIK